MANFTTFGVNPAVPADTVIEIPKASLYRGFGFALSSFGAAKTVTIEVRVAEGVWVDLGLPAMVTDASGNMYAEYSRAVYGPGLRIRVAANDSGVEAAYSLKVYRADNREERRL